MDLLSLMLSDPYSPLLNWQQNTPALNPLMDMWTALANARLMGWEGGPAPVNYQGIPQTGFGPTPLQNYLMNQLLAAPAEQFSDNPAANPLPTPAQQYFNQNA